MFKTLEKDIQLEICNWLAIKGFFFWRNNTTGVYDPTQKLFRAKPKYALNGLPDIIIIKNGIFIGLEVKRPKARQSDAQVTFQNNLEKNGGQYYVVHSLLEV